MPSKKPKERKKSNDSDGLMDRTRAAVAYLNTSGPKGNYSLDAEMYAFLSLFHPEMDEKTKRELATNQRQGKS